MVIPGDTASALVESPVNRARHVPTGSIVSADHLPLATVADPICTKPFPPGESNSTITSAPSSERDASPTTTHRQDPPDMAGSQQSMLAIISEVRRLDAIVIAF